MTDIIREIPLENGLLVRFCDHTRHYYGDFHLVKIEVVCEVPLRSDYLDDAGDLADALVLLGDPARYRRIMEQMGVPSTSIVSVRERLIENFISHSLPYLASSRFPARFLHSELQRARKKRVLPLHVAAFHNE